MRIGIDIGGTKAHAIAIDHEGVVLGELRLPSGRGDAVLATVREAITRLSAEIGARGGDARVESLGMGIPGWVDADSGVVSHAVNLGIERLELGHGVADLVDGPVRVDNDVNAAALGAFALLEQPPDSRAYLNVVTGLAAGIVLDGRVWRGFRGIAGEVGHLPVDPDGIVCICGQIGCLETVASGIALRGDWAGGDFATALARGDAAALRARRLLVHGVTDAVQVLFQTIGVETVVLGGGVVNNLDGVAESVRDELAARASRSPFVASLGLAERLRVAPNEASIPAIGAALLAEPHSRASTARSSHRR
ncbi:MAG: sugar kinase [Microbacteriaceae bacterium]|nr:sugar kinase [Microbacteriaceae bacterium]